MPERFALVDQLPDGITIGPSADGPCEQCGHRWGAHGLHPLDNPIDGGTWSCPECVCFGTWSVPMEPALRRAFHEQQARRVLDE